MHYVPLVNTYHHVDTVVSRDIHVEVWAIDANQKYNIRLYITSGVRRYLACSRILNLYGLPQWPCVEASDYIMCSQIQLEHSVAPLLVYMTSTHSNW